MSNPATGENFLLARLPRAERQRLVARMEPVSLDFKLVLYKARAAIAHVYFPTSGAVSALTMMDDGNAVEVATIGNEGMVGHNIAVAGPESINEVLVQIAGKGLRMDAVAFQDEASKDGPLRQLVLRYHMASLVQISQSVGCNGLHPVQQRCCRWLLITLDRMESNVVPLTHEFIAIMLGVRRASVSEILRPLHERGLISNNRGAITVLDREGLEKLACECYRKVRDEFERILA